MSAPVNGGPDWALAFAEFHARHRDVKGRKLVFTVIFNAAMESFISCPEVPLLWRVLAWIWRHSWGNSSDFCVDQIGGKPVGQQDCADEFGVAKQRVNDCVSLLRELYFVLPPVRHMLYPVDDPVAYRSKNSEDKANASPDPSGLYFPFSSPFAEFCHEWKVRDLAEFEELESAEATVNRLKIVRLGKYKEWLKARSIHALPIKVLTSQQVMEADQPSLAPSTTAAAGRPDWHSELRQFLQGMPIATALDEPMFRRIAGQLSEELLPQFKTEAEKAKGELRKWAGYEAKAKQVAARGLVVAVAAPAATEESALERMQQMLRTRLEVEEKLRGGPRG